RAAGEPHRKEAGAGVFSSWLLAGDGHVAGQATPRRTLGQWRSPLENMVNSWRGRRVFLTGHTGFKGGWLALWLAKNGAQSRGYALDPCTEPNLFTAAAVGDTLEDIRGDVRDRVKLE